VLSRALFASQRGRAAGTAIVVGWLAVGIADVLIVAVAADEDRVAALGLGNSVGMLVMVAGLLLAVRRGGSGALAGFARALAVGSAASAFAIAAGLGAARLFGDGSVLDALVQGVAVGAVTLLVFVAFCWAVARGEIADAVATLRSTGDDRDQALARRGPVAG
jgi:putative peptidoglycan lipid II flippase